VTTLLGLDREPASDLPITHQLRFDTGSVALNLLATTGQRGSDDPAERLPTVTRLRDWLAANGLPTVAVDAADLAEIHRLREAGYAVLAALATGRRPPTAALAELGGYASRPLPAAGLQAGRGGVPVWAPPTPTFDGVLTGLARDLAGAAVERAEDLRLCESDRCRMVYLDTSRGRRRRWCSMGRCGNAAKAARHRARTHAAVQA
jgi:predicted RNA-binding Zn ribbon-like protein